MFSRKKQGLSSSVVKGLALGLIIFSLISLRMVSPASAGTGGLWAIGAYYSGSLSSSVEVDVYNTGMPADSAGDITDAVLTASINGYVAQISIQEDSSGSVLFEALFNTAGALVTSFGPNGTGYAWYHVSGLLNSWHYLELLEASSMSGGVLHEYLAFDLDGTQYGNAFQVYSCSTPCSAYDFSDQIVPNIAVESGDLTNADFSSLNVHGYFETPAGTIVGSMYLYSAYWGEDSTGGDCALPSGAQTTSAVTASDYEGPNSNGAVTGHLYRSSGYGASDEWGIGSLGYYDIDDADLSSTFCSTYPQLS